MYMCRYMFIWAVFPTTVEMDLSLYQWWGFIINRSRCPYMYGPSPFTESQWMNRVGITRMCGIRVDRETGPLEIDVGVGWECTLTVCWPRTRALIATALRHTSIVTRPSVFASLFNTQVSSKKQQNMLKMQTAPIFYSSITVYSKLHHLFRGTLWCFSLRVCLPVFQVC